jgi:hypothetical protein
VSRTLEVLGFGVAILLLVGIALAILSMGAISVAAWAVGSNTAKPLREWQADRRKQAERDGLANAKPLISTSWVLALLSLVVVGAFAIVLYATQFSRSRGIAVASVGAAVAAGALMAGTLVGFLFGVPRSVAADIPPGSVAEGSANAATAGGDRGGYRANTNLEQISDWLTKILVGVGLTQLIRIPDGLAWVAHRLGPALAGGTDAESQAQANVFGVAVALYFLQCGFLYGYIWSRVNLGAAFRNADVAALGRRVARQIVQTFEKQNEIDAVALNLANRQLDPAPGAPEVQPEELLEAVRAASPPVKVQIFEQARRLREASWRTDPGKVLRTIPVFKALVESAPDRFHRNHAQLGYALKDQPTKNWADAERALSNAIRIRGDAATSGYPLYEFNRALCRIQLDPAFAAGKPSTPEHRARIEEDLKVAGRYEHTVKLLENPPFTDWRKLNP